MPAHKQVSTIFDVREHGPAQQGLRQPVIISQCQTDIVREHGPAQQGLRLSHQRALKNGSEVREHGPAQQGLGFGSAIAPLSHRAMKL